MFLGAPQVSPLVHGKNQVCCGHPFAQYGQQLSDVPDILHVQHNFFEIFLGVFGFSKGKINFFSKVLKIGQAAKNGLLLLRDNVIEVY